LAIAKPPTTVAPKINPVNNLRAVLFIKLPNPPIVRDISLNFL
jgi:hypothetical protein